MKEYDAYLFDADGTIIDTRELIYRSFMHMGRAMGVVMPPRDYIESTTGLPVVVQLPMLLGEGHDGAYYDEAGRHYSDYMMEVYRDYLRSFPDTAEVLAELKSRGKKLAVVTSRRRPSLELFLDVLELKSFFDLLVTPEDTSKSKPDPEPAFFALSRLNAEPGRTVFIGDAEFDMRCGKAAGTDAVYVEWGGMDYAAWPVRPDYVAGKFTDLLPDGRERHADN